MPTDESGLFSIQNPREGAQIVHGQNEKSMQGNLLKDQTVKKTRTSHFPDFFDLKVKSCSELPPDARNVVRSPLLYTSQARKRHINMNFFVRLLLGRLRECPGDKPGLSLGQNGFVPGTNPGFSLFYTAEAQFVPGTKPSLSLGQPWGRRAAEEFTVGTKIIADPEKCFQELISEKLLIFIAGWALLGINYRFQ